MMKHIKIILSLLLFISLSFIENVEAQVVNNIDVAKFSEIVKDKDLQLVDVRTAKEVMTGKIEGAINVDYFGENFKNEIAKLDKEKAIAVYCRSGNRSGRATNILKDLGFTKIYNLNGGMKAWKSSKMPVVK